MGEEIKEFNEEKYVEMLEDGTLYDYITNLQEENERLKEQIKKDNHILGCNFAQKDKYKSRCEKAIEYIKEHQRKDEFLNFNEWQTRDLLNILNGGDDNE